MAFLLFLGALVWKSLNGLLVFLFVTNLSSFDWVAFHSDASSCDFPCFHHFVLVSCLLIQHVLCFDLVEKLLKN